jgi:hypothetical protein
VALSPGPADAPRGAGKPRGGFSRGARVAGAAEGLGTALVVLALVAAAIYAATRPTLRVRVDLTEGERYTLTEQTRQVLGALPAPVTFVALMRPEAQVQGIPNGLFEVQQRAIDYVENLLQEYVIASGGRVTVRTVDPNADRIEAERLVKELHLTRYNVVVAQCGERTRQVFLDDMATIDRGLTDPELIQPAALVDLRGEEPLTAALLAVTRDTAPRAGFLQRLGGPSPDDYTDFGLGWFAESLRGQGFEVTSFDLADATAVPADLDLVIVWGPALPLGARVAGALRAFHERGGALLLGIDPVLSDSDLDRLLERLGVARERSVLTRDDVPWEGERRAVLTVSHFLPEHEISAAIARQGTFARMSGAGGLARYAGAPSTLVSQALAVAPESVFGDRPLAEGKPGDFTFGEGEVRSPRFLAFALSGEGGRSVVFGNSSFLTNAFLTSAEGGQANVDLGLNAAHWLAGREEAVGSRPRQVFESRVDLTDEERTAVSVYVLLLMPLGGALLGALVWFARRR